MNDIAQIITDGILTIRGLTEQDAHRIVVNARRDRESEIKSALVREHSTDYFDPVAIVEFCATYPDGEECAPSAMHYSATAEYRLDSRAVPVTVQIAQGMEQRRAIAILRHHAKMMEAMPPDEWSRYMDAAPWWPKRESDDANIF